MRRTRWAAAREGRFGRRLVAEMGFERAVARHVVQELRRIVLERIDRMGHGRKRLPIDHDRFGRIPRLSEGLGDHHGDGLADKAGALDRQRPLLGDEALGPIAMGKRHVRPELRTPRRMRYRLQPVGERVGARQNRQHAGKRQRRGEIHAADGGMGMRRAHYHRPRRMWQIKIDGILPAPGDEAQILPAMAR